MLLIGIELDIGNAQLPRDGEKLFHRHGGGTWFLHRGRDAARDGDVKIGRSEDQAILLSTEKDVGQNRQRGAGADDVLDRLQSGEQLLFRDGKVHVL